MFRLTDNTLKLDHANVTVRCAHQGDSEAIARLAALDSAKPPRLPLLVAESDSRILAALSLSDGGAIADPFQPTGELKALLELRAEQLKNGARQPSRTLRRRLRSVARPA